MNEAFPREVAEIYDHLDLYDYDFSAGEIARILNENCVEREKSVLEVGVGTGRLAEKLLKHHLRLEGLDCSLGMLEQARKRLPPGTMLHQADVKDFSLSRTFTAVISHAGPLRLDATSDRGHFFETYLKNVLEVDSAASSISRHLSDGGVLILSSETSANASDPIVSRTLSDGRFAISQVIESVDRRTKIRELKHGEKTLLRLEHSLFVLDLDTLNEIFMRNGFKQGGFDSSGKFYVFQKSALEKEE